MNWTLTGEKFVGDIEVATSQGKRKNRCVFVAGHYGVTTIEGLRGEEKYRVTHLPTGRGVTAPMGIMAAKDYARAWAWIFPEIVVDENGNVDNAFLEKNRAAINVLMGRERLPFRERREMLSRLIGGETDV